MSKRTGINSSGRVSATTKESPFSLQAGEMVVREPEEGVGECGHGGMSGKLDWSLSRDRGNRCMPSKVLLPNY